MDHQREKRPGSRGERGFTLVEVLVSALLFAIGMIALIAMQYSALGGYTSARDVSQATQVGDRVIQIARLEAQQWRQNKDLTDLSFPYGKSDSSLNALHDVSGSILNQADGWSWSSVFPHPVDERLTTSGAQRFCAYVRGGTFGGLTAKAGDNMRMQVAVAYAGPGEAIADSDGDCPGSSSTLVSNLTVQSNGRVAAESKGKGYRVVMLGAVIRQRVHLGS